MGILVVMDKANPETDAVLLFGVTRAPAWMRRTAWAMVCAAGAAEAVALVHLLLSR